MKNRSSLLALIVIMVLPLLTGVIGRAEGPTGSSAVHEQLQLETQPKSGAGESGMPSSMKMDGMAEMMHECMETKKDKKTCEAKCMKKCGKSMGPGECKKMMKQTKMKMKVPKE